MLNALLKELKPVIVLGSLVAFALAYIHFCMTPILTYDEWTLIAREPKLPDMMSVPGLFLIMGVIAWVFAEDRIF